MSCHRKHTFMDTNYNLYYKDNKIEIGQKPNTIKYTIPFSLSTQLEWLWNSESKPIGFKLIHNGKWKEFYMEQQECLNMKNHLNGKIQYIGLPQEYSIHGVIAKGGHTKVLKVQNILDGQLYGCKAIQLDHVASNFTEIKQEVEYVNMLDHPNIFKISSFYATDKYTYLIMPYNCGGSLRLYLDNHAVLAHSTIKIIMKQMLSALAHMHSKGIVHRDIKPENVLLSAPNDVTQLKLIDFGFASPISETANRYPQCGTPGYIAPEIINFTDHNQYNELCDVFSCGVMFYRIVTGKNLFPGQCDSQVFYSNEKCDINEANYVGMPIKFRILLERMLDQNAETRISAKDALHLLLSKSDTQRVQLLSPGLQFNPEAMAQKPRVLLVSKQCLQ